VPPFVGATIGSFGVYQPTGSSRAILDLNPNFTRANTHTQATRIALAPGRRASFAFEAAANVDNRHVSYFGIQRYQPQWRNSRHAVTQAHGRGLHALIGRRLTRSWLVWNRNDDKWFADCPVLLDFEGEQVEINHQKFDDLSITWNSINPSEPIIWTYDDHTEDFPLRWRDDACPRLAELNGQQLETSEVLEWTCRFSNCVADSHLKWRKMADPPFGREVSRGCGPGVRHMNPLVDFEPDDHADAFVSVGRGSHASQ
jgi:hypothetical protein